MKLADIVQNIFKTDGAAANLVKDPICGMKVDLEKTKYKSTYEGKEYGFCSASCKAEFDSNPGQYAGVKG